MLAQVDLDFFSETDEVGWRTRREIVCCRPQE
jgi:hypothetical protein